MHYERAATGLDSGYLIAHANILLVHSRLVSYARSENELTEVLAQTDEAYRRCSSVNGQFQQCHINYLTAYARAADRQIWAKRSAGPTLQRARDERKIQKIGGRFLDAEQYSAWTELAQTKELLSQKQDPQRGTHCAAASRGTLPCHRQQRRHVPHSRRTGSVGPR